MPEEIGEQIEIDENGALRAMFRARKEVFIDLLKWDLPVLADEFEVDQFDRQAEYLILLEQGVRHRASTRLLRTDHPHLLGDLYPHLCAGPVPTGPTIREITRFCLDRHQRAEDRRSARNQLVTALAEHALATGITAYTGVAEQEWFEQIRRFGWDCKALGQPVVHEARRLVALHIQIDDETIDGLRAGGVYEAPRLMLAAAHTGRNGR
ncbi:autoinducer synthase [Sphingobium sp. GW456-12-10-14-TSB1]|jgi:acyl homoserine lactone synthase/acyl-homoserine lactone synthase|uniref:acyl-homoserine-lactone synthase n=1 Tax=Sphingobium sp. GW456-12-10-14-TSB1 TaxID=1987165 RepID=UPI000A36CDEA|nr:acyl-homoserine-lactone synthase [Sphingobium sp. GW456-12-10-14-TSB1]OUC56156.1 autoinducer synthase [Sphingobium sp. GW456-12-10-14-TSB1]|tara:strand:+ start:3803 stop:4429 length:627 start_codon:yes stop_codon:yes gene_type:complete